jgi:uncharacterized protein (DUF1697 family)
MTRWVCLLRGINVGGNNLIKMTELAACLLDAGLGNVTTYIASGNVLFEHSDVKPEKLEALIEKTLSKRFGYESKVVLRSHDQLERIIEKRPKGFGSDQEKYRYDVMFLKDHVSAKEALAAMPIKEGVDKIVAGDGVLYASRVAARASQSKMARITQLPVYKHLTIRNWNTTAKLLALLEA